MQDAGHVSELFKFLSNVFFLNTMIKSVLQMPFSSCACLISDITWTISIKWGILEVWGGEFNFNFPLQEIKLEHFQILCYSYGAHSYNQYINQQMHSIKYSKYKS